MLRVRVPLVSAGVGLRCRRLTRAGTGLVSHAMQDTDIQVFRFTLGIPGFDDAYIPRVAGLLGASLLVVNHSLGVQALTGAQFRAEVIAAVLASVLVVCPSIEKWLKEASGAIGRRGTSGAIPGSSPIFAFDSSLPEGVSKELAWATFAGLRNTNACSMLFVHKGEPLIIRGSWSDRLQSGDNAKPDLASIRSLISDDLSVNGISELPDVSVYYSTRDEVLQSPVARMRALPVGANCAFLAPMYRDSFLLVLSDKPRGLGRKDRCWLHWLAQKVASTLPS